MAEQHKGGTENGTQIYGANHQHPPQGKGYDPERDRRPARFFFRVCFLALAQTPQYQTEWVMLFH
jgi:hypothetical protein